jgi:hypothetical protein
MTAGLGVNHRLGFSAASSIRCAAGNGNHDFRSIVGSFGVTRPLGAKPPYSFAKMLYKLPEPAQRGREAMTHRKKRGTVIWQ